MKTLVISPHIDDEVLGCGGAILNRSKNGDQVFVYYLGVEDFHEINREGRLRETSAVAQCLGFDYAIGANKVNAYRKQDLINELTDVINVQKPDEVFIPLSSYNQDHREVHDAAVVALRPHDRNHFVRDVKIYEVDQYQLWAPTSFQPNYFERIDIQRKVEAYLLHASQVRPIRPKELLVNFAYIRGLSCGEDYAEGFVILRLVR